MKFLSSLLVVTAMLCFSCQVKTPPVTSQKPVTDISQFLGQWTIDVKGGGVSWLEVRKENNYLDGDLLWIGGSVSPISYMYLAGDVLVVGRDTRRVVRTRDEEGKDNHEADDESNDLVRGE